MPILKFSRHETYLPNSKWYGYKNLHATHNKFIETKYLNRLNDMAPHHFINDKIELFYWNLDKFHKLFLGSMMILINRHKVILF